MPIYLIPNTGGKYKKDYAPGSFTPFTLIGRFCDFRSGIKSALTIANCKARAT
jgi:hypothetical protein